MNGTFLAIRIPVAVSLKIPMSVAKFLQVINFSELWPLLSASTAVQS